MCFGPTLAASPRQTPHRTPSPITQILSPMFSNTSAHSRPHPLSFHTLPQNTRGWGTAHQTKLTSLPVQDPVPPPSLSTLNSQLSTSFSPLTPLFPLDTK